MSEPDELFARWRNVWRAVTTVGGDPIFFDLVARHSEPHRAYHTLEHIADCQHHLDMAKHLLMRPAEVELAIWFHDAIYDPRRDDNEERSALLAEEKLQMAAVDRASATRTAELIRLTTHDRNDLIGDGAILCDVDLAVLGAEPRRFDSYDAAIRQEYHWVPEKIYRVERGRVLARFLNRPRIYQTQFFYDRHEQRARFNLIGALRRYRV
jgi:predicted metal-dependent HD superfamily phosphohydrolase